MKIACDSCGAKYTIADENVSGKTVKIRCKKCGATMVIDGHAVGASAAAAISSGPAAPSAELPSSWMIHSGEGAQETVTADQVVERYRNGSLDGSAYVWREGMADWKLLRDVPELFSVCVASVGAAVPPAAASRPVESARRASSPPLSAPIESSSEGATAAHEVPAPAPAPAAVAVAEAPRGALSDLVAQSATPSTAPQATAPLTGQRNDNSVLFSLASLSQNAPGGAPAAAGSDQSGLIDMRALAQIAPKAAPSGPKVDDIMNLSAGGLFGGGAVSPVMTQTYQAVQAPAGAAAAGGGLSPKVLGLAVGGGALVVALVGGGLFFALRKSDSAPASPVVAAVEAPPIAVTPAPTPPAAPTEAPAAAAPTPPPAAVPAPAAPVAAKAPKTAAPPPVAAPAPTPSKGGVSSNAAAAALFGPGGAASKPAPTPAPAPAAKAQPAATPASLESAMAASATKAGGAAPAAKAAPAPAASGAAFDRGAAAAALRTVADGVASCRRPSGPNGDGHVTVTFRNDGAVDHVEVDRPPYQGTPVGACVASKFKLARVPAFGGAPITVGKSFSID